MKMQKRKFRIGELAEELNIERFVIRFWEKEFNIKTTRSEGGQRFYSQEDFDKFKLIKELLYHQGFTIAGAKKQIDTSMKKHTPAIIALDEEKTQPDLISESSKAPYLNQETTDRIMSLKKKLYKLRDLLQ
jgi:DNA-binding transcriptional MerR regulator